MYKLVDPNIVSTIFKIIVSLKVSIPINWLILHKICNFKKIKIKTNSVYVKAILIEIIK